MRSVYFSTHKFVQINNKIYIVTMYSLLLSQSKQTNINVETLKIHGRRAFILNIYKNNNE